VPRVWVVAALFLVLVCVAVGSSSRAAVPARTRLATTLGIYAGVGSWLDIFGGSPWRRPVSVAADLRARGVATLYLQTSNYSQRADIVRPHALGRLLDAAHAAGLKVVAWYLPSFADPATDNKRALAAIRFRSPSGGHFDSFALDIEASLVRPVSLRNSRLLTLVSRLRTAAPARYPLGAIIPSPVGMARHPHYWPHFPYAELARRVDAFLPMAYFSRYVQRPGDVYNYTRRVVLDIREQTGRPQLPIHAIGGLASTASAAAIRAFVQAASDCGIAGASLYAYPQTTDAQWQQLAHAELNRGAVAPACTG